MDLLDKRNCYIVPEILYVFLPGLYLSQIFIFDVRKSLNTKEGGNVQIHNWCNVKIFVFQLLFFLAGIFTIGISPSQKQTRLVISKIRLVSLQWIPRIIKKESELEKKFVFFSQNEIVLIADTDTANIYIIVLFTQGLTLSGWLDLLSSPLKVLVVRGVMGLIHHY